MFRRFEVAVDLKAINTLVINFTSSGKKDLEKEAEFKEEYGFTLPQNYSFTRKAAYQYGWDWGPRILTLGIWKEVNILIYNHIKIENLRLTHTEIDQQTTTVTAKLTADLGHLDPSAEYLLTATVLKHSNN